MITKLDKMEPGTDVIVVIPSSISFEAAAQIINQYNKILNITGAIVQRG